MQAKQITYEFITLGEGERERERERERESQVAITELVSLLPLILDRED